MDPIDETELRRRLKAARALTAPTETESAQRSPRTQATETGITVDELADRIDETGLGRKTLGAIERGERKVQRSELIVMAEALELPLAFFTLTRGQLLEALGGAGAPGIGGATGRRLQGGQPSREHHAPLDSAAEEGSTSEAAE